MLDQNQSQHVFQTNSTHVYDYPYRHVPFDDLMELRVQLETVTEKVTELFANNLDAIPEDLAGINSAYLAVEIELAWRELDSLQPPMLDMGDVH